MRRPWPLAARVRATIAAFALALVVALAFAFATAPASFAQPADGAVADANGIFTYRSALLHLKVDDEDPAPLRRVALPYQWDHEHPGRGGRARFTLGTSQQVKPDGQSWALYFPRIGNRFRVFVNGVLLADEAIDPQANIDHAKTPELVVIAPGHIRGGDSIDIDIWCDPTRRGGLSFVEFGPSAVLTAKYKSAFNWRTGGSLGIAAISAALGALGLLLWIGQRSLLYLAYGLAETIWALRVSDLLIVAPPLRWPIWGSVVDLALAWYVGLLAVVSLRVLHVSARWITPALLGYMIVSAFVCVLRYQPGGRWLWTAWIGVMLAIAIACAATVIRSAWVLRRSEETLLAIALVLAIVAGVRDWMSSWAGLAGFGDPPLARYVTVLFGLSIAWIFARRYTSAVVELGESNRRLEQRVAERERELRAAFESARQTEQRAATLAERNRLMRDMHDGVGSLLSAALRAIDHQHGDPQAARGFVGDALEELKLTVDSLQPNGDDLGTVLGSIRFRLQDRMQAAGIECGWEVPQLPRLNNMGPAAVRSIQHLIVEAFGNAMRHGNASRIALRARAAEPPDDRIVIDIEDNGVGFDTTRPARGQGIRIMRERAADLGGSLELNSAPGQGCRVRIALPLNIGG